MAGQVERGRLTAASEAPAAGERFDKLLTAGDVVVGQILSGVTEPTEYIQEHDEWVVVLEGSAGLEVGAETLELAAGDWVFLPALVSHRVTWTQPGTSWLAVHLGHA